MRNSCISVSLPPRLRGSYKANHSLQDSRNTLYNALYAYEDSIPQLQFHLDPTVKC